MAGLVGTSASFSEQNLGIQLQRMAVILVMLVTLLLMGGYRHVPGMMEPVFVGLADLQSLPHIWHGIRILTQNPEISGLPP